MKTSQLHHVLRAIDTATEHGHTFLLLGSQAILAHLEPDCFPSDILFKSREIDVAVLGVGTSVGRNVADVIAKNFGDGSRFDQTYGYHADGVETITATLPMGWEERLMPYEPLGVAPNVFFALSYEDLVISKLYAGRPKDLEFVKGMCSIGHPRLEKVLELLNTLPDHPKKSAAIVRWENMYTPPARPSFKRS